MSAPFGDEPLPGAVPFGFALRPAASVQPACGAVAAGESGAGGHDAGGIVSLYAQPLFPRFAASVLELDSRAGAGVSGERYGVDGDLPAAAGAASYRTERRSLRV